MFRGQSPIFDAPEFPPLRRVKPLPKRRRTSDHSPPLPDTLGGSAAQFVSEVLSKDPSPVAAAAIDMSRYGLNVPLQPYYMAPPPSKMNGVADDIDVGDIFRVDHSRGGGGGGNNNNNNSSGVAPVAVDDHRSSEFPGGFAIPVGPVDDDDHGDGDYIDHLHQPGNTKKRKVPAAAHSLIDPHHGSASVSSSSPVTLGEEDHPDGRRMHPLVGSGGGGGGHAAGNRYHGIEHEDREGSDVLPASTAGSGPALATRRPRYTPATMAGLQHKELLKTRRRQLGAVLGAITHGDTLALEQALSARYTNLALLVGQSGSFNNKENMPFERIRKKPVRRKPASWARFAAAPTKSSAMLYCGEFMFSCPSPTSERLVSTREEVARLHAQFEAELARQAAKAAEMARQNAVAAQSAGAGAGTKKRERALQRTRTSGGGGGGGGGGVGGTGGVNAGSTTDSTAAGAGKGKNSKKKKRSALANASNPHHLRNYVPSRLPHSGIPAGHGGQGMNALNLVSPLPVRFLTTEMPPRRRKKTRSATATTTTTTTTTAGIISSLMPPEDEWICPLCEYNLFYGDESAFRRAIRSRKKILNRRRRARERAAAAASGQKAGVGPVDNKVASETFDGEAEKSYGVTAGETEHGGKKERDKAGIGAGTGTGMGSGTGTGSIRAI